jgi:hypothetical protein
MWNIRAEIAAELLKCRRNVFQLVLIQREISTRRLHQNASLQIKIESAYPAGSSASPKNQWDA